MSLFRGDNKVFQRFVKGILVVLICVPLWITVVRYSAWKMPVFLIFWILGPGIFIEKYILKQDYDDWEMVVWSGFFVGMAFTFIEWFALYVFGLRQLITLLNPCITVVCLIRYFLERKKDQISAGKGRCSIDIPFLIALFLAVYLCAYYLNFRLPRAVDIRSVDCTWQIGNINQLASEFPFHDIRVEGVKARYHFFSTMFLAVAKYIFGGEGWIYFAQYQIWFLPLIITISFRKLYGKVTRNQTFVTVASVVTMVGFSFNSSYGGWQNHLFSNVNSVGLGISCLILLFLSLEKTEKVFSEKWMNKYFLQAARQILLLFLLAGIKGPFALLYVLAVCVWAVVLCVKRKTKGVGLAVFAVVNVVVFAGVFFFLFSAGTKGYFSDWNLDSVLQSAVDGIEIAKMYERLGFQGVGGRAVFLIPSLIATFTFLVPFGVLAIVDLIRFFFGKKDLESSLIFADIYVGGGLCAFYLFHILGNSQLYFLFATIPFVGYLCFHKAFELTKKDVWKKVFYIGVSAFVLYALNSNVSREKNAVSFFEYATRFLTDSYPEIDMGRTLVFEAYDFLREHTDKDALIATNYRGAGTFHDISAFGERRCYLEGYEYSIRNFGFDEAEKRKQEMERLFDNRWNSEDRYGFCEAFYIDYLVYFKEINGVADEPLELSDDFQLAYDNEAVSIYEVRNRE